MAKKSKKSGKAVAKKSGEKTNGHSELKFWGWRRENDRVGVRNHVVILRSMISPMPPAKPLLTTSKARLRYRILMADCSSARISNCISAP